MVGTTPPAPLCRRPCSKQHNISKRPGVLFLKIYIFCLKFADFQMNFSKEKVIIAYDYQIIYMKPSSLAKEKDCITFTARSAFVKYKFRARCNSFYYGDDCSQFCLPKSDSTGHYACSDVGGKSCLHG